jgi:FMN phosphatase YigB (HAD superfamily)
MDLVGGASGMDQIKLVIVDLDNTIYNWVDYYAPSFRTMLEELVKITGLNESALKGSFKRVHERHRTSEYSFAIEELDVLSEGDKGLSISERLKKYNTAIHAFRKMRKETLKAYPGVVETLEALKAKGKKIVAHTDAMMFYAINRVQTHLKIGCFFDGLFAIRDHGLPSGVDPAEVRHSTDPKKYECTIPVHLELDPNLAKPDPRILELILSEFEVSPENAIYIGDSLHKDVRMAQNSGVHDVFAAYGRKYDADNYRLLVEITHWTDEDVSRETELSTLEIKPNHTIYSFPEILSVVRTIETQRSIGYEAKGPGNPSGMGPGLEIK